MLRFIFTKIKNKYKLYIALLVGVIVMIAVFGVVMLLRKGSLDRLIQSEFVESYKDTGHFPAVISRTGEVTWDKKTQAADAIRSDCENYEATWDRYINVPVLSRERIAWMKGRISEFSYRGDGGSLDIGFIDEDYLGAHFRMADGDGMKGVGQLPENHYPCLISAHTADVYHLVVGETLTMKGLGGEDKPDICLEIVGIAEESGLDDYYWQKGLNEAGMMAFLRKEDFHTIAEKHGVKDFYYEIFTVYDYRYFTIENADQTENYLRQFREKDADLTENLSTAFISARQKRSSVNAVLYAITVPLILLVVIFISMISVRIINSEQREIAMLHSRGMRRLRIMLIYLVQSLIIAVLALGPGILLGYFVGRWTASVTGFLNFSPEFVSGYGMYPGMALVSGLAALLSVLIMVIPVIRRSAGTVVETRRARHDSGTPLWEKFFLDVVLLGVSVYFLYDFTRQSEQLKLSVLSGEGIDPMIFLDATFFLISCGLLILRLISYLVRLIFRIGKNRFRPAGYASFLQIIRTRKGAGVISVFLVLTVALSIFNANMARTINANQEARIRYNVGTDLVVSEEWQLRVISSQKPQKWKYSEPDFGIYRQLVDQGLADSVTQVIRDDHIKVKLGSKGEEYGTLMGINTKEFGETAELQDGLSEKHWYHYLNELSQSTNGVLISRNLAEKYQLSVGDALTYSKFSPLDPENTYATLVGNVVDIVDAFPGYETTRYSYNEEGELVEQENYLLVGNSSNLVAGFERVPYDVWIRTGHTTEEVTNALKTAMEPAGRSIKTMVSQSDEIHEMQESSMIKITNGLFTLDVLVAILLCVIGYLIHWITAIRDRSLLFGIYRAMGISMQEVSRMLTMEQLFLSLGPVLAGIGAGSVATLLFAKLFSVVYLPEKHAVTLSTYVSGMDFLRLAVIIGSAMILCFVIIRRMIRRMKITDALKLGED